MSRADDQRVTSTRGHAPDADGPAPGPIDPATGQHDSYWILSEAERVKGFVRPVRLSYWHRACATVTTMTRPIAETYAREPRFYSATFCCRCKAHLPVGDCGDFFWIDADGRPTDERVGGSFPPFDTRTDP